MEDTGAAMADFDEEEFAYWMQTCYDTNDRIVDSAAAHDEEAAAGGAEAPGEGKVIKPKRRGGRRHNKGQILKKPMGLSEIIQDLQNIDLRENALRCLSGHLLERREENDDYYRNAAYMLYFSCSTLTILIQEVMSAYNRLFAVDLNVRGSKRLANVLTLFQSIASSNETRLPFVRALTPNLLLPFILSPCTEDVYENVRTTSLSVFHLLCKECEREVIEWALEWDIIPACIFAIEIGSRLSKVVSMSILELILKVKWALEAICEPNCLLAMDIVIMLSHLVAVLGAHQDFSTRLAFQVVRSYILLCQEPRALDLVTEYLPQQLQDHTFHDLKKVYPLFRSMQHQLLLNTGKAQSYLPNITPDTEEQCTPSTTLSFDKENIFSSGSGTERCVQSPEVKTPLRPVDLNKADWSSSARVHLPDFI